MKTASIFLLPALPNAKQLGKEKNFGNSKHSKKLKKKSLLLLLTAQTIFFSVPLKRWSQGKCIIMDGFVGTKNSA